LPHFLEKPVRMLSRREEEKAKLESDFGQFPESIDSRDLPMESFRKVVRVMELDAGVLDPMRYSRVWVSSSLLICDIGGIS